MDNVDHDPSVLTARNLDDELPVFMTHERPTRFESSDSQNEQPVMMTTLSIQHSDHDPSITTKRGETTIAVSIGDEDQGIDLRLTENVVPDIENQTESITTIIPNHENDSSNNPPIATRVTTTPHTALLHNYSNPKIATYFVGVYPAFLACFAFFTSAKNSPFVTHKSLMRSSLFAYFMAILVLRILFCLHDHLKRTSNQHFYLRLYKVLTYVYDILWMLAILLAVPALPQR